MYFSKWLKISADPDITTKPTTLNDYIDDDDADDGDDDEDDDDDKLINYDRSITADRTVPNGPDIMAVLDKTIKHIRYL